MSISEAARLILEGGLVAFSGEARSLLGDARIREAYLGE